MIIAQTNIALSTTIEVPNDWNKWTVQSCKCVLK